MPDASPWDGLTTPEADFNVRRVAADGPVSCFWGLDISGSCLFIVELQGDHTAQFRKNAVTLNGVDVELRTGSAGEQRLVLVLDKQVDRDLFGGMCRTLVSALAGASDSPSALAVTLAHLSRWKLFMAGSGGRHLSDEAIRGLFAELIFLKELIEAVGSARAVGAWLGPERSHQDFILGNTAVEIKSMSGAERSAVRISSEDQLETPNDNLFLRIYRLSELADAPGALSLNGLISLIEARIDDSDALLEFTRKLLAHAYAPLAEYDEPLFAVSEIRSYRAEDTFPRLVRSSLPSGIMKVSYDIRLEAIEAFKVENDIVFEGL
jgi:hypothetical protein